MISEVRTVDTVKRFLTLAQGVPMVSTGPGHGGRAHAPNEYVTLDTIPRLTLYVALLAELAGG